MGVKRYPSLPSDGPSWHKLVFSQPKRAPHWRDWLLYIPRDIPRDLASPAPRSLQPLFRAVTLS
jgi:hypothetical protein